jgi:hypothetical protein
MAFDNFLIGRVYVIRWIDPTVADGIKLLRGVEQAHERLGEKLIYVAIAPRDSPPPPEQLRMVMASHLTTMLLHCEVMHLVFEGVGFSQTVKRMALASIVMVSGMKGRMLVHGTTEQLIAAAPPDHRVEIHKALKAARIAVAPLAPGAMPK